MYAQISKLNPDLNEGQHDAEEALSLLLNAMHDEIVTVRKAAGVCRQVNGTVPAKPEPESGDGWKTTTRSGRSVKQSVNTGTDTGAYDISPISSGFRGLSHSSIKVANHASPPPTEQPFFTLQLDVASPLNKTIDDAIKAIPKEENLEGYQFKGSNVTVSTKLTFLVLMILGQSKNEPGQVAADFNPALETLPVQCEHEPRRQVGEEHAHQGVPRGAHGLPLSRPPRSSQETAKVRVDWHRQPPRHWCRRSGVRIELFWNTSNFHKTAFEPNIKGGHYTADTKRGKKWYKVDDNKVSDVRLNEVLHTDNKRTPYLLERDFHRFLAFLGNQFPFFSRER